MSYELSLLVLHNGKRTEWMLLLVTPYKAEYHWLFAGNGPGTGNPAYRKAELKEKDIPDSDLDKYRLAWLREQEVYGEFRDIWNITLPGPNKHFLVRVMDRLASAGFIERSVVDFWRARARYHPREIKYFKKGLSNVDENFFNKGEHEDHVALYQIG
ncbi:uncharacterized protein BDV17DRAFT_294617 [Aspergillus undulatus]|uniref:uncharacterized protein n=1 Tax=Aspergillus undulatus TaxID=1810928 RepID=UPI003CCDD074